jgi:Putative inner membrane protein (DUF1819)
MTDSIGRESRLSPEESWPATTITREPLYTTRIQKAAGALPEVKTLLSYWDDKESIAANLERFEQQNILGKRSRTRTRDLLHRTFSQRYLADPQILPALLVFVRAGSSRQVLDPILYFIAAQSDPLLHDAVTDLLSSRIASYSREVTVQQVEIWLARQIDAGRTSGDWSETTITRVARSLLAALRDFGLLGGRARKRVVPMYLPITTFAFVAFLLHRHQRSGDRLLHDSAWRLFFLPSEAVERLFLEAHQEGLLGYHAAGPVVRIEFPASTPQGYANVLTQRTN